MAKPPGGVRRAGRAQRSAPPAPSDPHAEQLPGPVLRTVLVASLVCVTAWTVLTAVTTPLRHLLVYQSAAIVIILVALWLNRAGRTRQAAVLFALSIWAITQLPPFVAGHLGVPGIMLPLVSILGVGLVWSIPAALILAPVSSAIWLMALWARGHGWLPAPQPRDDLQFWFVMTASLAMMVVFLHVSTRALHKTLEQARTNAAQAARLMREAPDPIIIVDGNGVVLSANAAVHRVTGVLPTHLVGRTLCEPGLLPEDHADRVRAALAAAFRHGAQGPFEVDFQRPDGTCSTLEAMARVTEWDGTPSLEVIFRDITARREVERERLALAEEMTRKQKLDAVGQLAGGVAHDFNNLLTVVGGCADLIREDPTASESVAELAAEIQQAQRQAAHLTRRLLAFAQRQVMERQALSISSEVKEMEGLLRTVVGEGVELEVSVSDADTTVHFDHHQLEQILVNLAANARHAMDGVGRVDVGVARRTLDAPVVGTPAQPPADEYVCVSVKDEGHGIAPGLRERIFEPFFTTRQFGGSGLGLSAVLGIVQQAGGHIAVLSEAGKGAEFRIYLPPAYAEGGD